MQDKELGKTQGLYSNRAINVNRTGVGNQLTTTEQTSGGKMRKKVTGTRIKPKSLFLYLGVWVKSCAFCFHLAGLQPGNDQNESYQSSKKDFSALSTDILSLL